MNRRLHLALALLVAAGLVVGGAWLVGFVLWPDDDYIALSIGILWGVVVGLCVNAYWLEVIDR